MDLERLRVYWVTLIIWVADSNVVVSTDDEVVIVVKKLPVLSILFNFIFLFSLFYENENKDKRVQQSILVSY